MIKYKSVIGIILILTLFSFGTISVLGSTPTFSGENPTDDDTGIDAIQSTVNVTIENVDDTFNWTIQGLYITNAGANGESNGSKSANTITPLPFNTTVRWYVNVTDGTNWTNVSYNFTTKAIPELSNEHPVDTTTNVDVLQSTVDVTIYHFGQTFNWTIQGLYITNAGANGASNGSKSANTITPLPYETLVTWYVNVTDGTNWTNASYSFTTRAEVRLTEHFTDPSTILLCGLVSIFLMLGIVVYAIKTIKEKTFKIETFITMMIAVIVIIIALSFI